MTEDDQETHFAPRPRRPAAGVARDGIRQLFVMRLADRSERRLTDLESGRAAMWAHWQPVAKTN